MLFPQLSNFEPKIVSLLKTRAGNNQLVSSLMPWFRLASFAGAGGLVLESIPSSESFASRYGGSDITSRGGIKSGRVGTTLYGSSVYTTGDDRLFRPSPTIEGLNIEFGAGGLNRKATFTIKAYTLKQTELLSTYFMEPGFTILVEYGWNTPTSISQKAKLTACEATKFLNYIDLKKKQLNGGYEYDGFLGYITGANLKSSDGESYIIEVNLTAIGDIAMYLQQHRGGSSVDTTQPEGDKKYSESAIKNLIPGQVGKALFYQMFNRLPQAKQTNEVKALTNDPENISENNFMNMDNELRKEMGEELSQGGNVETSKNDSAAEIPEGVNILSESTYIRLGLAFKILNAYASNLKAKPSSECSGTTTMSLIIDTKNTICRGFNNIFSTDGSKLMIPNPNTPDFGLLEVLTTSTESDLYSIMTKGTLTKKPIDLAQPKGDNLHCFPQQKELSDSRYLLIPGETSQLLEKGTYGFLEDLFINFEFFCEVLGKSNYVTKDVYYELLNGISSAANSIWQFEIVEQPSPYPENYGQMHWRVVDQGLCGIQPSVYDKATKFQSTGANTPFLTSELSLDLPAVMKNQIVAQRSSGNVDVKQEGDQPQKWTGIFATKQDPVLKLLDSFQEKTESAPPDKADVKTASEAEEELRKKNMEMFTGKATVITLLKNREADHDAGEGSWYNIFNNANASLDKIAAVVAWNDTTLFRTLDRLDVNSLKANNVLVPIEFSFSTFGVSGIKTGDLFRILDLPKNYTNSVFQVVTVSHELGNNTWTTTVKGKLRNIN